LGDAVTGGIAADVYAQESGNMTGGSVLALGLGNDTYSFAGNTLGTTVITDTGGVDTLLLPTAGNTNISSLNNGAAFLTAGNGLDQLIMEGGGRTLTVAPGQITGAIPFNFTSGTTSAVFTLSAAGSLDVSSLVRTAGLTYNNASNTASTGVAGVVTTLNGSTGSDTITGFTAAETFTGDDGADTITGGTGLDTFVIAAGDTVITIGGAGDEGTVTGFDVINDAAIGTGAANSETFNVPGTAAIMADGATDGTNSTLTIGGVAVKSHTVATGIASFDDADTYAAALTIDTPAKLAAVLQYLQANDIGDLATTIAFRYGTGTVLYTQGTDAGTNGQESIVHLVGVAATALITTNATTASALFIS
jgi:hypothetical protein